jgi:hypothetical protein
MFGKKSEAKSSPVNVRIEKMNPYKLVVSKTVNLESAGDETTVFRFKMDKEGNIVSLSDGPQRKLVKKP